MTLSIQIKVLIVSFVYGIILAYIVKKQYKYFFYSKLWYRIIINLFFVFDVVVLYFLILKYISDGLFHIYFLFIMIIGYIFGFKLLSDN